MKVNTEATLDMYNTVTMDELERVITTNMKKIMENPGLSATLPPILIHSSPGIGKSSLIKQIAADLGIGFVDVRLAELDSVDIRGLPSVDKESGTMRWNAPDFWPRDPKSKGIIFFDELTAAPRDVQVASYEIILDRKIGEFYKVPDGWYICAAGNSSTDHAVATSMSSALANRFLHFTLREDAQAFLRWANVNGIHPSVTGFLTWKNEMLFNMKDENLEMGWPSPRSWHRVSEMVHIYGDDEAILRKIVYGLIGRRAGSEFIEYHKLNESFDSVLDMMYGKKPVVIPDRNDMKYSLCSTMVYLLWRGKDKEDEEKRIEGFYKISSKLTSDFASLAMINAIAGIKKGDNKVCAPKLYYHNHGKSYDAWQKANGAALRKRMSV
jgi:hypothetical protein